MLVLVKTVSELVRCRANDAGQDCWSYCSRRDNSQAFVDLDSRRHTCRLGHRLDLISTSGHSFRIMFSFFRDSKNKKHLFFYNADSFQIKSSVSTSLFSPAAAPAPAVRVRDESGTGANTHHNTTQPGGKTSCWRCFLRQRLQVAAGGGFFHFFKMNQQVSRLVEGGGSPKIMPPRPACFFPFM